MRISDIIAAISTPPGISGVALIRMTGEGCIDLADKVFRGKHSLKDLEERKIAHGEIVDPDTGEVVDEVLLWYMKAPRSYTGEDMVEISCHGGRVVPFMVLEALIKAGARLAEPGEFTRRAFLNKKFNLIEAQGLLELINATSRDGAKIAYKKLRGELSKKFEDTRKIFLEVLREFSARIDFPEYVGELSVEKERELLLKLREHLKNILKEGREGRKYVEGIEVAIVGKPNVGKSTLFNAILGKERAIVTPVPGTTRDLVSEEIILEGIPVKIYDTAGWRKVKNIVERIGVERAQETAEKAGLILFVVDGSQEMDEEDRKLYEKISDKSHIIVVNKKDLGIKIDVEELKPQGPKVEVSSLLGEGIDKLKKLIVKELTTGTHPSFDLSRREESLILSSLKEIEEGLSALKRGLPLDIITFHVEEALRKIDELLGIGEIDEAILDEVFSHFCIGK